MSPAARRQRRRRPLCAHDPVTVLAALQEERILSTATLHDILSTLTTARGRSFGLSAAAGRPAGERPGHALVVLAAARVLLDQLGAQRWEWTRDALDFGAQVPDVAHVLGLDVDEVRAGLRSWAWRRHEAGGLDAAQYAAVLALVAVDGGAR